MMSSNARGGARRTRAAHAVSHFVTRLFFGVRAADWRTNAAATFLVLLVAVAAGLVPAMRAMRTNPEHFRRRHGRA